MADIKKIVLTGGPCAGKTTALVKITEYFSGFGYKVFNVPEVPTIYSTAGWNYLTPNRDLYYQGELAILETQLALENQFIKLAEVCHKPVLVVCDRGTLDISAYIKPEEWEEITAMAGTNSNELRERYDAVLHLVSAADGAEQYYTTATNATRYEQANEEGLRIARELDKKVIKAWTGHPHLRVINNHNDFENKLNVENGVGEKLSMYIVLRKESLIRRSSKRNVRLITTFTSRCYSKPIHIVLRLRRNVRVLSGKDNFSKSILSIRRSMIW